MNKKIKVLIAGIGGASLGTEILKCLQKAENYEAFGTDISAHAYGHYKDGFKQTFVIDKRDYVKSIVDICCNLDIRYVIPGGEEPMVLLGRMTDYLKDNGICLVGNSAGVIETFSNKDKTFSSLAAHNFDVPKTKLISDISELNDAFPLPCIIKPAEGSGGSSFVYFANNKDEICLYLNYLKNNGKKALVQEYIPVDEGEFTVGVLSLPDKRIVGSTVLKRIFNSKLSVLFSSKTALISSGYSQGLIDHFSHISSVCEEIAQKIESTGPINVQGRLRKGKFYPFEINPRFSASTYLRAMAGFNEIDIYIRYLEYGIFPKRINIKPGYYLRSLEELYVEKDGIK